jgi:hypothetical protein
MTMTTNYRIGIRGHLDATWSDWFEGMTITHEPNGDTTLTGPIVDQAALQGVLAKITSLGLTLLAVNRVDAEAD